MTTNRIRPLTSRIQAIKEFPIPQTCGELQQFLGIINYYHRFLPGIVPLPAASAGLGKNISWKPQRQKSFEEAKSALSDCTLLYHPRPDAKTSITVNASDFAIGAQLEQLQRSRWVPIAIFSRKLSATEKNYSAFDRELLGSYEAIKHFRHFDEARLFTLYTDLKPLTYALPSASERFPRQAQHLSFIAEFISHIQYIRGKHNVVADALSRIQAVTTLQLLFINWLWTKPTPRKLRHIVPPSLVSNCKMYLFRMSRFYVTFSWQTPQIDLFGMALKKTSEDGAKNAMPVKLPKFNAIPEHSFPSRYPRLVVSSAFTWI